MLGRRVGVVALHKVFNGPNMGEFDHLTVGGSRGAGLHLDDSDLGILAPAAASTV